MWTKKYLLQTLKYYRNLDFFQEGEYKFISDSALITKLLNKQGHIIYNEFKSCYTSEFCYDNAEYDFLIVCLDLKRILRVATDVLYHDPPPNYSFNKFCKTFQKIEKISRGIFCPQNIKNIQNKSVNFTSNNKEYDLSPEGGCDDPLILARQINPILSESGYQFELFALAPDVFMVVLTTEEKEKLAREKQWNFVRFLQSR